MTGDSSTDGPATDDPETDDPLTVGAARVRPDPVDPAVARIEWAAEVEADDVVGALAVVADRAFAARPGLLRLVLEVPDGQRHARRAALRAGFRLEGRLRAAHRRGDGTRDDVVVLSRLRSDVTDGPEAFSAVMTTVLPRKRLIAHVIIRDEHDRVLLCRTSFKSDWELPGGIVEPGEPPRVGAVREVAEELGVDWPVGRLLIVDWLPPYLGWEDACELIFDGGRVPSADLDRFTPDGVEIVEIGWCTLDEARELVTPLSHRRLSVAASAAAGTTVYTEDGVPADSS